VAIPVAAPDIVAEFRAMVDDVVCLHQPDALFAIGLWYEDFRQVRNDEVVRILERARPDGP
jgi:putative phosphoribosyl transferase